MSKRVTLNDDDITLIMQALKLLEDKSDSLPNTYPEYGLAARQRFQSLKEKLKSQHPRSVETLGVSGNGDTSSIAGNSNDE